ncbi:MAG: hypothetical protein CM1200mP9_08640 [Gammaproteobacteria bacterium]|nr:MAG: hypothetical protein CM1200mP9_08640 [Gammaproteobacteria bacterium]
MGVTRGDVVSVFMENRIEFLESVIALNKIGATGGLINTNLRGRPLTHCISVPESKKCIFGAELAEAIQEVKSDLNLAEGSDYLFVPDGDLDPVPNWALNLETEAANPHLRTFPSPMKSRSVIMPSTSSRPERRDYPRRPYCPIGVISRALCFPYRWVAMDRSDRLYICLPLYHGTGLLIGAGASFSSGAAMVIRRRFSASRFLPEVREHGATCLIYVGELCRISSTRNNGPMTTTIHSEP